MGTFNRIPKWLIAIAEDEEQNIHGLTASQIADRYYTRKWPMEQILSTPLISRSEAGRRAAKKSPWGKWQPGLFSEADSRRNR
jgi:hypothetical protein